MAAHVTPPRRELSNRSLFLGAMIAASALLLGSSRAGDFVVEANAQPPETPLLEGQGAGALLSFGRDPAEARVTWTDSTARPEPVQEPALNLSRGPGLTSSGESAGVPTPALASQPAEEGPASVALVQEAATQASGAEPANRVEGGERRAEPASQGLDRAVSDQRQAPDASLQPPVAGRQLPVAGSPATRGTPAAAPPAPEPAVAPPAVAMAPLEGTMLAAINARRAAAGLRPVAIDRTLTEVARERSNDMAGRNYFSHTTPEGAQFLDLLTSRSVQSGTVGEILGRNNAADQVSVGMVVDAFGQSPSHNFHVVYAPYEWAGVGVATGQGGMKYYTIIFRAPA